jgi:CheY-like chemotaxis protein
MLGQLGVSAVMVPDGHAAIRAFETERFDVVILDISMPDIDGIEVMQALRCRISGWPRSDRPEILAFTANAMAHQVEAYLHAGFDACLTKPLQLQRLASVLQEICNLRQLKGRDPARLSAAFRRRASAN